MCHVTTPGMAQVQPSAGQIGEFLTNASTRRLGKDSTLTVFVVDGRKSLVHLAAALST